MQKSDLATSARMAGIGQKNTSIEMKVAASLRELGLHYRKNVKALPGSPDLANRSRRWAVFVNGCFWHHHSGCKKATVPRSNSRFWIDKFIANRRRDALAIRKLRAMGFTVVIVWECKGDHVTERLRKIFETSCVERR